MCLIKLRPNHEEDNIVPNRPVHTGSRSGVQSEHQPTKTTNIAPIPGFEAKRGGEGVDMPHEGGLSVHKREEDPAFVIIEQQGHLYDGEVVTTAGVDGRKVTVANERKYSSRGGQGPKRSESVLRGRSPRQSNASFRTTRERIVVVDEGGRKREYYQRDDSGR